MRALAVALFVAGVAALPRTAGADLPRSCAFLQVPALPFGAYDALAPRDTTTVSDVRFTCHGTSFNVQIAIDGGRSGNVLDRRLIGAGGDVLHYQIYQDVSRLQIWGNGASAPPVTIAVEKSDTPILLHAYAVIPAGQDVGVGAYADSLLVTVLY